MVLFEQIGMACFTKDEAKRLIGIVNMGAAFANLANGLTVAVLIHFFDSFAILPAQMVLLLVQLIPNAICRRWTVDLTKKEGSQTANASATATKPGAPADEKGNGSSNAASSDAEDGCLDKNAWYMNSFTQLIGLWQFLTVLLFSLIEFQYNSTLAHFLDANGIAQVTASVASVASVGQTLHEADPNPQPQPSP